MCLIKLKMECIASRGASLPKGDRGGSGKHRLKPGIVIYLTLRPLRTSILVPPAAYVSCWGVAGAATHLSAITQSCLLCCVASWERCPTFIPVADPGGVPPARAPPKGPDYFVLTYKFFETEPPRELAPPPTRLAPPLREILDPPLYPF